MAKDNPILPTPAGRKQVVVVEEKGWERRNTSVSLPGAGTGKGRRRDPKLSLVKSLCVWSAQSQHCHTMSARSALILLGLAVTPFWDRARLTGTGD